MAINATGHDEVLLVEFVEIIVWNQVLIYGLLQIILEKVFASNAVQIMEKLIEVKK